MASTLSPHSVVRISWQAFAAVLLASVVAAAQTAPVPLPVASHAAQPAAQAVKLPEFEVASVKENKSGSNNMQWRNTPDGMIIRNFTLKSLIASAYGIKPDLVSGGPGWIDSIGFDVDAKLGSEDVPAFKELTGKQKSALLKPLLADRFHLKAHIEQKILPIYDLEIAKGGSKLKTSTLIAPSDPKSKEPGAKLGGRFMFGPGQFKGDGIGISSLADNLAFVVHRPVIDKTGLTATYDFEVKYAPEDDHGGGKPDNGASDPLPSIFTALEEQLGLKLQSTKGPVDTLVIDHVEKPSEN